MRGMVALAVAAVGCGRIDFDPVPGGASCNWSGGPRLFNEHVRDDVSTPLLDSDPHLVRGDPLTLLFASDTMTDSAEIYTAHRTGLDAPFDPPTLITELSTTAGENGLVLDRSGHGYFAREIGGDQELVEVQRSAGLLQIVRELDELNGPLNQNDPYPSPDGLWLWFATDTVSAKQDIMLAHRPDRSAAWGNVEPFEYNTSEGEASPTLTDDQRVVLWAGRSPDGTNGDIYYATRPTIEDPWSAPERLALETDIHENEPSIRGDGCELFFVRSLSSMSLDWNIYSVDIE
ncbi:MAG TPA: hypothetical protein VFV99_10360 [Kofleriaceae bacterium]|nr:hypothetical protein [Kofleriaceae bacterium]